MSNLVLNSLTYVGQGIINGVNRFIEKSAGLVTGFVNLTNRVAFQDKTIVHWKLVIPTLVPEDSECGCAGQVKYTNYLDITVRYDRSTTAADRTAMLTTIRDLVATANFGDSITSLNMTP